VRKPASGSMWSLLAGALTLATFLSGCTSGETEPAEDKEDLPAARRLIQEGKLEEAHRLLKRLVQDEKRVAVRAVLSTELATVLCLRADAEPKSAKVFHNEAAGWARKAIADAPGLAAAQEALGTALLGLDRLDEAMVALQEALAADARRPAALRAMGLIEYRRRRYTEAIGRYRQARVYAPDDPRLVYNLAVALEARGRLEDLGEAKVLYRLYVRELGTGGAETGEAEKAIEAITRRLEAEKNRR